jgi:hypothetical protein
MTRKDNKSKPKTKKGKEKVEESDDSRKELLTCKKNDSKKCFCRQPVSSPGSFCRYHSNPKVLGSPRPCKKRDFSFGNAINDGFYYYAGFGPSRSTKRQHGSSGSSVQEPAPDKEKELAQLCEDHIDLPLGQTQDDGAHGFYDDPRCNSRITQKIVYDKEIDNNKDKIIGCNGEPAHGMKMRKRKRVNTRSINSLM